MNITIDFDGLKEARAYLEKYSETFEDKCLEVCRILVETYGEPIAKATFGSRIMVMPIDHGYSLSANGEDVFFIEFGTGVRAGAITGHPWAGLAPGGAEPGSWSKDHAQQFTRYGGWWFGGHWINGTEPYMGMYHAWEEMVAHVDEVVAEVFK